MLCDDGSTPRQVNVEIPSVAWVDKFAAMKCGDALRGVGESEGTCPNGERVTRAGWVCEGTGTNGADEWAVLRSRCGGTWDGADP